MNLANSHHRRLATWRRLRVKVHTAMGDAVGPDDASAIAVREELAALPARQREALVLRYFADLSVRETAVAMQCPEGTVKTHTRRALEALRSRGLLDSDSDPAQSDQEVDQ
jgi:DNA-directed RNA polymerase specialized sigma24 family protein